MKVLRAKQQADFFKIVRIRTAVFVLEQQVNISIEQDKLDDTALHWFVESDQQEAIACCRGLVQDSQVVQLGRVAVLQNWRSQHVGRTLMLVVQQDCKQLGFKKVLVHAQAQVEGFYTSLGYTVVSEPFYEAGIKHLSMEKSL